MKDEILRQTTGMCSDTVDGLTASYSRNGMELRTQTRKEVLSRGGPWTAVAFEYAEDGDRRVMLAFFKSAGGTYRRFSYFTVKSKEEAGKIRAFLAETFGLEE